MRWVWGWLQERRRARASGDAPIPPAPVITGSTVVWVEGKGDVTLTITFDQGSWPVATIEVYAYNYAGDFQLVGTFASNGSSFVHHTGSTGEEDLIYRARYRNSSVVSPYSNEWPVGVWL